MEINEPGQDELPGRVNAQRAGRDGYFGGRSDRGDPLALDEDGGIGARRGAGSVNDGAAGDGDARRGLECEDRAEDEHGGGSGMDWLVD